MERNKSAYLLNSGATPITAKEDEVEENKE